MTPSRGEVWLVSLDPTMGDEIRKSRPAVVVNRDALGNLDLRVVVPITGWQSAFMGSHWLVQLDASADNGLTKMSAADTFQVRSISSRRFVRRLGELSDADMARVVEGLKNVFDIS